MGRLRVDIMPMDDRAGIDYRPGVFLAPPLRLDRLLFSHVLFPLS
jgi:hypothetical protein